MESPRRAEALFVLLRIPEFIAFFSLPFVFVADVSAVERPLLFGRFFMSLTWLLWVGFSPSVRIQNFPS